MKHNSAESINYSQNTTTGNSSTSNCTINTLPYYSTYTYPNYPGWWPQTYPGWINPNYAPIQQIINVPIVKQIVVTPAMLRGVLNKNPEAYITVNKSRTKMFCNNVYIADETDFEIELFNPSNEILGVKFRMNGQYISESHFVLRPGMRVFLDRYLNENRKFKYVTYNVEDTKESKDAIAQNGLIQVEFYREYLPSAPSYDANQYKCSGSFGQPDNRTLYGSGNIGGLTSESVNCNYAHTAGTINPTTTVTTTNVGTTTSNNAGYVDGVYGYKTNINNACMDWLEPQTFSEKTEIETGMIAKGEESETEFTTVDMQFETSLNVLKTFKILPLSHKPIEAKDLIPKCSTCNAKGKKEQKFCANCGNKL